MNKQEKQQEIDSLRDALKGAPPTFVLAYRGLTVNQVSALRKKVRATASRYRVVKNRLALRVLKETALQPLTGHFKGPTAIAYGAKDPSALAKVLEDFTKENQGLQVKAGWVDGRLIGAEGVKALASLPSREVLVSRILAVLNAPMIRLLTVLKGPARGLVQAMDQIARKKETAGGAQDAGPSPQS
jgi:large subunit ribosomal protein L10